MQKDGKPLIFVSYADRDEALAGHLCNLIERFCSTATVWRSGDGRPHHGCTPGSPWFDELHSNLNCADYVLALVTPNSIDRPWIYWESGIGFHRLQHADVVPIVVGMGIDDLGPPLSHLQGVDATNIDKLKSAMLAIAGGLNHSVKDKDARRFCAEFRKAIEPIIPTLKSPGASVLADRTLISQEQVDEIANRLGKKLEELGLSKADVPLQLEIDQKSTQEPDPDIEAAAQQVIELGTAGVRLPAELARSLATQLYRSGDFQSARAVQSQLVTADDATAEDWSNLGILLKGLGRKNEAEDAYRKAIAAKPDYAEAWNNLAALLMDLDRKDEAEDAYRKAVQASPDLPEAWCGLGVLLADLDRKVEAEDACRRAIAAKPDFAEAWNNLGYLLMGLDRIDEAEDAYRQPVLSEPDNPGWWNQLAYCLWKQGKFEQAEVEVRKALALDPNHSYANATLGVLLFEKNQLEKGRRQYEKAIEVNPDNLRLQQKFHYEYGRALGRNGKKDQARKELELAKSIDATFVALEDIEGQLRLLDEPEEGPQPSSRSH